VKGCPAVAHRGGSHSRDIFPLASRPPARTAPFFSDAQHLVECARDADRRFCSSVLFKRCYARGADAIHRRNHRRRPRVPPFSPPPAAAKGCCPLRPPTRPRRLASSRTPRAATLSAGRLRRARSRRSARPTRRPTRVRARRRSSSSSKRAGACVLGGRAGLGEGPGRGVARLSRISRWGAPFPVDFDPSVSRAPPSPPPPPLPLPLRILPRRSPRCTASAATSSGSGRAARGSPSSSSFRPRAPRGAPRPRCGRRRSAPTPRRASTSSRRCRAATSSARLSRRPRRRARPAPPPRAQPPPPPPRARTPLRPPPPPLSPRRRS
jgi:hypothetical protein